MKSTQSIIHRWDAKEGQTSDPLTTMKRHLQPSPIHSLHQTRPPITLIGERITAASLRRTGEPYLRSF
ncbi:hypothetical protein BDV26DRAFT_266375, partial [Aspergillus bertholletiae]